MKETEGKFAVDSRAEQPESGKIETSVVQNILQGKAKIKFLSESMEERDIIGKGKFQGSTYSYRLEVPHLTKPGEKSGLLNCPFGFRRLITPCLMNV